MYATINKLWDLVEKAVRNMLNLCFKISNRDLTEDIVEGFIQFIKFGIVGVSNTLVYYMLYAGGLGALRQFDCMSKRMDYLVVQFFAFSLSVFWSFYWNNKMVFVLRDGERRSLFRAFFKTYVSYSFTGLFLNSIMLFLLVQTLHISAYLAPIFNLIVNVPINFLLNKFWAFQSKDKS